MSKNVKELLRKDLLGWLMRYSDDQGLTVADSSGFWVLPVPKDDPEYSRLVREEFNILSTTKIRERWATGSTELIMTETGDTRILITSDDDSDTPGTLNSISTSFELSEIRFLQKTYIVTSCAISSRAPVPARAIVDWVASGCLIGDIEPFFPTLLAYRCSDDLKGISDLAVAAIFMIEKLTKKSHLYPLSGDLRELAILLPAEGHNWLFDDLFGALMSNRPADSFLMLYRMIEFFFPLQGVNDLRTRLSSTLTHLELLQHCKNALAWQVQHSTGARRAATFADSRCVAPYNLPGQTPEDLQRSIEEAAHKLVNLRNYLAHQSFGLNLKQPEIDTGLKSAVAFLIGAFRTYAQWCGPAQH